MGILSVLVGEHVVALANGDAINVVIKQKGVDWNAVATLTCHGDTINIVERDYLYPHTLHQDIMDDICDLVQQNRGEDLWEDDQMSEEYWFFNA